MAGDIRPYHLDVPQADLDDLDRRLARTRWPDDTTDGDWSWGTPIGYLRELVEHWRRSYDWRAQEELLNAWPQFTTPIDGHDVHFVHVRSPEDGAMPLLLAHGWPGSIVEFLDVVGPLTDPRAHGGDPADAFDVVVPSPPGFTLSGPTRETGWTVARVAEVFDELMRRLGYDRYVAHGGDFGAITTRALGLAHPDRLAALHLTYLPSAQMSFADADLSDPVEARSAEASARYEYELGAYAMLQATRPQLVSYGLTDSPVFQLAWIVDGFREWTSAVDVPEEVVDRDTMLTNVMLYWLTGTAGSSARYYKEGTETWGEPEPDSPVPTAMAVLPSDLAVPVRRLAERNHHIVRWTEYGRGGHFAALEAPDLLIDDLRAFFRDFREA